MPNSVDDQASWASYAAAREAFLASLKEAYPHACMQCEATGVKENYSNAAPYGSGESWMMYDPDDCPDCKQKGLCPLCGQPFGEDDEDMDDCPHCEWDIDWTF